MPHRVIELVSEEQTRDALSARWQGGRGERGDLEGAILLAQHVSQKAFTRVHTTPAAEGREAAGDGEVDVRQQPEAEE
jgi:hypothetical protein